MSQPCNAQSDAPGHCEGRLISENPLRFPRHVEGGTAVQTELTRGWHLPHQALGPAQKPPNRPVALVQRHDAILLIFFQEVRGRPFWLQQPRTDASRKHTLGILDPKGVLAARGSAWLLQPVRASAHFLVEYQQDRIMALYERYRPVRRLLRRAESLMREVPATGEFSLYSRTAFYVTGKAQRILGYQPTFTMARGIALSVAWLRHEGYLRDGGTQLSADMPDRRIEKHVRKPPHADEDAFVP